MNLRNDKNKQNQARLNINQHKINFQDQQTTKPIKISFKNSNNLKNQQLFSEYNKKKINKQSNSKEQMNQFLDQILNPISAIKRKSQTQNNNEVARKTTNQQIKSGQQRFDELSGHESHPYNEDASYEREQVTQELVFDRGDDDLKSRQIRKSNTIMHNSYSLGGLRQVRQVKIKNHTQNEEQFLRSQGSFPQQRSEIQVEQVIYQGQYNLDSQKYVLNNYNNNNNNIRRTHQNRVVQQLIQGINRAKQSHMQLKTWFYQQRRSFEKLVSLLQIEFDNKVRQVLRGVRQEVRGQLQKQYQQKSQQQQQLKGQQQQQHQQPQHSQSVLSTQQRWAIQKKLIKQELQQRYLYRIQKLQSQLAQKKHYEQNQYQIDNDNRNIKQLQYLNNNNMDNNDDNDKHTSIKLVNDNNNKSNLQLEIQKLNQQLQIVKFQLQQKNTLISQLEIENEKLNEHIFDVEQKIQGIELQVENKVRERIKEIESQRSLGNDKLLQQQQQLQQLNPILQASSHLEQSTRAIAMQSMNNINAPRIQQLLTLNEILKQKLQQIQSEKLALENQLKEHQKILSFREQQIQQNQQDINFQWAEIQKQRHSLMIRQQQLATAEQNVSKKISEIRFKQTQFQKWQNQLHTRQVNLDFKDQEFNKKLQDLVERQNIFKTEKERFLKEKQTYSSYSNNTKSRKNIQQFNAQGGPNIRSIDTEINQPLMSRKYYPQPDLKQQKSFQNEYQFRNRLQRPQFMKTNLQRSYDDIDRSYTRQNRQRERFVQPGTNNLRTQGRQSHQFILPQNNNSRIQHQSRSKSKSNQKILLRNNFQPSPVGHKNVPFKSNTRFSEQIHQNKSQSNLDGLGSKLQRLRQQIKKQIDSIK